MKNGIIREADEDDVKLLKEYFRHWRYDVGIWKNKSQNTHGFVDISNEDEIKTGFTYTIITTVERK